MEKNAPSISSPKRQDATENKDKRDASKADIRRGFEDFVSVNFQETGLLSSSQVREQRSYMESVLSSNNNDWAPVIDAYIVISFAPVKPPKMNRGNPTIAAKNIP